MEKGIASLAETWRIR